MAFIVTVLVIAAAGYGFYRLVQSEKTQPVVAPPVAPEPPPQPKPLW
jgi:hypothetical protein